MTTQPADHDSTATTAEGTGVDARPMLEVVELSVTYPRTGIAVDALSFTVHEREAVAILGPNGAGKTTTVRAITGFLSSERVHQRARRLTFRGRSIFRKSPHAIARAGVSVIPERDKVFRQLRVSENLDLARGGRSRRETEDVLSLIYQLFPILAERRSQAAGLLSGGQIQMLAIAAAVLQRPSLLVADEISLGLAPALLQDIGDALIQLRRELDLTMLLVEQNVGVARRFCDRAIVIEHGRPRAAGSMHELLADQSLTNIYLGGEA